MLTFDHLFLGYLINAFINTMNNKLLISILMLSALSIFAQSPICTHAHKHDGSLGCGIVEPDSTISMTINSITEEEPIEVTGLVKDGLVFLEGGILVRDLNKVETRGLSCHVCGKWPNGVIPYEIDPAAGYSQGMVNLIMAAIDTLNLKTSLEIVPRSDEANYLRIKNGAGCYSMIGNQQIGAQTISFKEPGCGSLSTIMHEFLHAAGILHEQSRADRNDHINIHLENVIPNMEHNFNQYISSSTDVGAYDKSSIMHYNAYAFSSNGQPTITNKDGSISDIGPSSMITTTDIQAVNMLYASVSPVEFGKYEVVSSSPSQVEVLWTTYSEINSEGFYLQRSQDAVNFSDVVFVASAGHLNKEQSYQAYDNSPLIGTTYYRLRQVDHDGSEMFSEIRKVYIEGNEPMIFPSIAVDRIFVNNSSIKKVDIYNSTGYKAVLTVSEGKVDVTGLPSGIYMIQVADRVHKIVKI